MGLFFYTKKGSIISTVDLPTTEIIEPFKVVKVPVTKSVSFNIFDEFVSSFRFDVRIREFNSISDVFLITDKGCSNF